MNLISLDIETYGSCRTNASGDPLPEQRVFHPRRSLVTDQVPLRDLVLTAALTWNVCDPPTPSAPWIPPLPGKTSLFCLWIPIHRRMLASWLHWADCILGMNLLFDLSYLRAFDPRFIRPLSPPKVLVDLAVINYLESELRPERSLKNLGPILGTHVYATTLKGGHRFRSPLSRPFQEYALADPHNTMLAARALALRIPPSSPKLRQPSILWYSNVLWTALRMTEAGVPLSRHILSATHARLLDENTRLLEEARPLLLSGPGSATSKATLLQDAITSLPNPSQVLDHPMLERTEKKGLISWSSTNRALLLAALPPSSPHVPILRAAQAHEINQKLLSTYLHPLLHGKRNDPSIQKDVSLPLIPNRPIGPPTSADSIAYPTWYPVPSSSSPSSEDSGGTIQGRITARNPACQTFPSPVLEALLSRYPGGAIVAFDLSQIELRVAALLSGDSSLLSFYRDGVGDLHTDRTVSLFGPGILEKPDFKKIWRQVGKQINFADLFLASPHRMQATVFAEVGILLPIEFFQEVVNTRPLSRPGLHAWQQSLFQTVRQHRGLTLPITGQSRTFLDIDQSRNEIVNFPIQTTAGNTLLDIQHRIEQHLPPLSSLSSEPRPLMSFQVYDAAYLDVPAPLVPTMEEAVRSAIASCATEGYWHQLQEIHGREVPLSFEIKRIQTPSP